MAVARFDSVRSLAYTGISGSYAAIGTAISQNWGIFKITNNTNGDLFISLDGSTDNDFVPAGSFVLYDLSTNAPPISQNDSFVLALNTRFYAKQSTAPTSGAVYVTGVYARR
jgi:hypothetical protein